jgi:hypothetical protein
MTHQLERRYRRLIAAYPTGHRAVYAEDMITTLMASAGPGQQRPGLRTGIELLRGAATAWALRAATGGRAWRGASAPAAVTLLALLILSTRSIAVVGWLLNPAVDSSYGHWGEVAMWLPQLSWLPITALAVIGQHRLAARAAWTLGIGLPAVGSLVMLGGWTPGYLASLDSGLWIAVGLLAAVGLGADRGLRPGLQVLGRTGVGAAGVGAVMIGLITMPTAAGIDVVPDSVALLLLATGWALIVAACVRAAVRDGRARALTTTAVLAVLLLLAGWFGWRDGGSWFSDLAEQLDITMPLTLLACSLAIAYGTASSTGRWVKTRA